MRKHDCCLALGLALAGWSGSVGAADLALDGRREVVIEREVAHYPVALVQRVDVIAVTPHARYVVYEDAPAYLYPAYAPYPPVVVRVPRYYPRGVRYNRPSDLPLLKRCLC